MYHKIQAVIDFEVDTREYSALYAKELIRSRLREKVEELLQRPDFDGFGVTFSCDIQHSITEPRSE